MDLKASGSALRMPGDIGSKEQLAYAMPRGQDAPLPCNCIVLEILFVLRLVITVKKLVKACVYAGMCIYVYIYTHI